MITPEPRLFLTYCLFRGSKKSLKNLLKKSSFSWKKKGLTPLSTNLLVLMLTTAGLIFLTALTIGFSLEKT